MTLYTLALFLHVVGAVLLFITLTLEGIALRQVRRATTAEQLRDAASIADLTGRFGPASVVLILVPALYMVATAWGPTPWVVTALAAWLLVAVFGTVGGVRLARFGRAAAAEAGPLSPGLVARLRSPLLVVSWRVRAAMLLGVLFLMSNKPGPLGAPLAIVIAAAIGAAASLPAWRSSRAPATTSGGS
jgi:hypothetical protein